MTSDNSQQGLRLPPHDASLCKVFLAIDRREGARFLRLPDCRKRERGDGRESAGKVLESSAHNRRRRRLLTWATRNKKRSRGCAAGNPKRVSPPKP